MEKSKLFCGVLVAVSVLALLFQGIGLFSPSWMRLTVVVDTDAASASGSQSMFQTDSQNNRVKRAKWDFSGHAESKGVDKSSEEPETRFDETKMDSDPFSSLTSDPSGMGGGIGKVTSEFDQGLFTGSVCVKTKIGSRCLNPDDYKDQMGEDGSIGNLSYSKMIGELHKCAVLASIGFVVAIAACVLTFILLRAENSHKVKGIICASLWGISVIFVVAAVSMQAQQNASTKNSLDILKAMPIISGLKIDMPIAWALIMSGLGCVLAAAGGVMVAVAVCYMPTENEAWTRFHNQAV